MFLNISSSLSLNGGTRSCIFPVDTSATFNASRRVCWASTTPFQGRTWIRLLRHIMRLDPWLVTSHTYPVLSEVILFNQACTVGSACDALSSRLLMSSTFTFCSITTPRLPVKAPTYRCTLAIASDNWRSNSGLPKAVTLIAANPVLLVAPEISYVERPLKYAQGKHK